MRKTDGGRIGVESDDEGSIVSNRLFIKVQIETPERKSETNPINQLPFYQRIRFRNKNF